MAEDLALDTKQQADATPQKALRRWLMELKLAKKSESDWRKVAKTTIDTYRGKDRKASSFNILWANTEVLRPALYNSPPKPDVRRRFRSEDMLGKAVSEVMERSTSYCIDAYDLDNVLQADVLDSLLPGRGISRVRYEPKISKVEETKEAANDAPGAEADAQSAGSTREEVEYEQAFCDHVQWDDFLHGPGRVWEEVPWVAFRHRLTREDMIEQFGAYIGNKITLDDVDDSDFQEGGSSSDLKDVFKRAELWEIWDKDGKKVFFVSESYRESVIYAKGPDGEPGNGEPPLKMKNFFPCPRPLQLVEDVGTLIPIPLFTLYMEQAKELDRISARITKIINACRVRFVHDSTLSELKALMEAGDNEGIPTTNARAWMTNGGIEKAIWFMPIAQVAAVLRELYVARDAAKAVIYEITGISDIIRGATNPNETLGAQQLKANSSSLRLQRMKTEVQRYARDIIRLLAELIGENFDEKTLSQMTGLQFPTNMQKQQAQLMMKAQQQQPRAPGQTPAPPPQQLQEVQQMLQMPSWEDILGVMRSDMQREYRVDVETDSTVAQSLQQDMEGMKEVLTSIVELFQGLAPAVQSGALSIDAAKAMVMSVVRRSRMGLEVEDALESGMQAPKAPPDPKAAADAAKQQQAAQQQAHDQQIAQRQQQHEEQVAAREQAFEQQKMAQEAALERQRMALEESANRRQAEMDASFERFKALLDSITKIEVAEIGADATLSAAQHTAAVAGSVPS